jgi:hypothetical protein
VYVSLDLTNRSFVVWFSLLVTRHEFEFALHLPIRGSNHVEVHFLLFATCQLNRITWLIPSKLCFFKKKRGKVTKDLVSALNRRWAYNYMEDPKEKKKITVRSLTLTISTPQDFARMQVHLLRQRSKTSRRGHTCVHQCRWKLSDTCKPKDEKERERVETI